jgi:hypothetical protein
MFSLISGIQVQYKYNIIYTKSYIQDIYLKVGLVKETKRGDKKIRKIAIIMKYITSV